jgi:hypothetical protein
MKKVILLLSLFMVVVGVSLYAQKDSPRTQTVFTWTGEISSDWYTPGNWNPEGIPSSSDRVIITGEKQHLPSFEIAGSVKLCKELIFDTDNNKSTQGTIIISGGEIIVDGSLTVNPGTTLLIRSDGALTVNGITKVVAPGIIIIESGGSLITNDVITGVAQIKRFIADDLNWHFLSSPVTTHEILDGIFAPTSANFNTTSSNTYDFYLFNPQCAPDWWINLRKDDGTVNTTDFGTPPTFQLQKGYLVAYGDGFPTTKTFTGNPNTGDKTFQLTIGLNSCSWNLLGNPYPSALSWNNIPGKADLSTGYYYVWNENKAGGPGYEAFLNNTYKTAGTNGNIPSMQGFFIQALPTGGKCLMIQNGARVHDGNFWLKKKDEPVISNRLKLTLDNGTHSDDCYVLFGKDGSIGQDWFDAEKLMSLDIGIPQIYTIVNNDKKTLFNAMPLIQDPETIPVGIYAPVEGDYTLTVSGVESFSSLSGLVLEDLQQKTTQNMVVHPVFSFHATGNEDAGRFMLHITSPIGINDQTNEGLIRIYSVQKTIVIACNQPTDGAQVHLFNLLGQEILHKELGTQGITRIPVTAPDGYYIVKVQTRDSIRSVKLNLTE